MTPDQLKSWRLRLGLTQEQAAEALGVTRSGVQHWEYGRREIPRYIELACKAVEADSPPADAVRTL